MSYERVYVVNDVEFKVVFDATANVPAQLYGLPEDCSPAEGGDVDLLEIYIGEVEVSDVVSEEVKTSLTTKISEDLDEIVAPDFDEPDWMHDDE